MVILRMTNHAAKFRYTSSNKYIATVDEKGKITAVGAGTCVIYTQGISGVSATTIVSVNRFYLA